MHIKFTNSTTNISPVCHTPYITRSNVTLLKSTKHLRAEKNHYLTNIATFHQQASRNTLQKVNQNVSQ